RQQTLHNTIAWSYDLLTEHEQHMLAELAVFVGGWTLEAVAAVCGNESLDTLAALVEKSLVQRLRQVGDTPRFGMFETIRVFALDLLHANDTANEVRRRHAAYYLSIAEETTAALRSAAAPGWLGRLGDEHDNIRAALGWALHVDGNPE